MAQKSSSDPIVYFETRAKLRSLPLDCNTDGRNVRILLDTAGTTQSIISTRIVIEMKLNKFPLTNQERGHFFTQKEQNIKI